jgi:two-component system chemotaxis response regulator CheY
VDSLANRNAVAVGSGLNEITLRIKPHQQKKEDATMSNRVLIVDDSMLMRKMVGDSLSDDGWEVAGEASNGEQAVQQYCRLKPDVVTLDIVMPGTDGLYALEHIMLFDPEAKVVVVSALNQTKLISEAIRKGAQDFIAKPFLPEQLQQTMLSCVAGSV